MKSKDKDKLSSVLDNMVSGEKEKIINIFKFSWAVEF